MPMTGEEVEIERILEERVEVRPEINEAMARAFEQTLNPPASANAAGHSSMPYMTDGTNADLFATQHSDSVKWVADRKCWASWDGQRWLVGAEGPVYRRARSTAHMLIFMLSGVDDPDKRKILTKWAIRSDSRTGLESMIALAKHDKRIEVPKFDDAFDRDPMLLNCANGILDLRTGKLGPHRREAMLTKITPVAFDPEVGTPQFDKCLLDKLGRKSHECATRCRQWTRTWISINVYVLSGSELIGIEADAMHPFSF